MRVVVCGASTTGLFAAYLLAREGVEVDVFEVKSNLDGSERTLIATHLLQRLHRFPDELIRQRVRSYELHSGHRSAVIELRHPEVVVERGEILRYLAGIAREAGARILLGRRVSGFDRLGSGVLVDVESRFDSKGGCQIKADVLVGADGASSTVRRGLQRIDLPKSVLLQARVEMPSWARHGRVSVWFRPDDTPYFYWLIPESETVAVVGLIAAEQSSAKNGLTNFLASKELEPMEIQGGLVPLYRFRLWENLWANPDDGYISLVGDAAGHVKVTTVGGLVTGLRGAKNLSRALLDGRRDHFEQRSLRWELTLHAAVRYILSRFDDRCYDALLDMLDGKLGDVLQDRTRDELATSYLRILRAEPRLVSLALSALARAAVSRVVR
jgi:flavin-dependent dehydrogenase